MRLCTVAAASFLFPLASVAASANLPVPSNLTADGVPPIPAPLMETLDAYSDFRAAAFLDWAPGSREMLIATRFAQTPQIHRLAMPGGARTQLTFYSDRISGARYRPSGGALGYHSRRRLPEEPLCRPPHGVIPGRGQAHQAAPS